MSSTPIKPLGEEGYKAPSTEPGKGQSAFEKTYQAYALKPNFLALASHLQYVYEQLKAWGANASAYRLAQLDLYAGQTSYDASEVLLRTNLDEARSELDDVSSRWVRGWAWARNICALLPLLLTWGALGLAAQQYFSYYSSHQQAGNQPTTVASFLIAWQAGFYHNEIPFSSVALADLALLTAVVLFTYAAHWAEGRALRKSNARYQQVTRVVGEYIDALRADKIKENQRADPKQWADQAERVIKEAMKEVKDTVTTAQSAIVAAAGVIGGFEKRTNEFFNRIDANIGRVVKDTGDTLSVTVRGLQSELGKYTDQTNKLLESVEKVQGAAETLGSNAGEYTNLARSIDSHIASLQSSQGSLVGQMTQAADSITSVANTFNTETLGNLAGQVRDSAQHLQDALSAQQTTPQEFLAAAQALRYATEQLARQLQQRPRGNWWGGGPQQPQYPSQWPQSPQPGYPGGAQQPQPGYPGGNPPQQPGYYPGGQAPQPGYPAGAQPLQPGGVAPSNPNAAPQPPHERGFMGNLWDRMRGRG